jgi:hypothetical protein
LPRAARLGDADGVEVGVGEVPGAGAAVDAGSEHDNRRTATDTSRTFVPLMPK